MILDNSPPEATLERGRGVSPALEEKRNSASSAPVGEKGSTAVIWTLKRGLFIPSS